MIGPSEKSARILAELQAFMAEHIYPNEVAHQEALRALSFKDSTRGMDAKRLSAPASAS